MLKTLDVLIGATTVLLLFSMPITVITQAITVFLARRGKHLKIGLADLVQQLGVAERPFAEQISEQVLRHPMIADSKGKLGSVIHREEFTKLLLDLAAGNTGSGLTPAAKEKLNAMLQANGVSDPVQALRNIRSLSLQLEASNPELGHDLRERIAILQAADSDFVARVNSWFDQTIDRVSQRFTHYTHAITLGVALMLTVGLQLNIITVVNRLSVDDQLRQAAAGQAAEVMKTFKASGSTTSNQTTADAPANDYHQFLDNAGLVSPPNWKPPVNWQKLPGMFVTALLLSLGAPFWYNALKNLLQLRSALAQKDDNERAQRQTTTRVEGASAPAQATADSGSLLPVELQGERGDLTAVG
jgi:hypothetical protein